MPLYEVQVKQVSTVYYEVEAKSAEEAATKWGRDHFASEFVEEEDVVSVIAADDRFADEDNFEDFADEEDDAYDG